MAWGMSCSILMLLALVACVNARTFYEVLGVEKNATPRELKKGYMRQVLKYHPDKNDAPDATEKFMEVTTAYECLGDLELRKKYDSIGHAAYVGTKQSEKKSQERQEKQEDPFSKFESFFRSEQKSSSFGGDDDDDDFFKSFFSEFENMFESHGFGNGGASFMSQTAFRSSGGGGIKMEMDGFFDMDDILFDPLWDGEEEEDDPSHFASGRSFFGGGHFVPPTNQGSFEAPHSSAHDSHARAHARAHQHHHNMHRQHHNMHQQHHNMHEQHHNMHKQHHNMHKQHHNMHKQHHNMHKQHHNMHKQQHKHQSRQQHKHQSRQQQPHEFHHQQEFKFFTSGNQNEEDAFGEGMFEFSNVFSDSSFGPKEFHFESSSSSSAGRGGARSDTKKTYSYETTSSTGGGGSTGGVKISGKQQKTCTVSKRMDSMGNVRESKTCS